MNFDLNDEQKEIKQVAHDLLAARSPFTKVREAAEAGEYDAGLWREIVELGWPGIAVSADHGGQDLGAVELAVLARGARLRLRSHAVLLHGHRGGGDRGHRDRWPAPALARAARLRRGDRGDREP